MSHYSNTMSKRKKNRRSAPIKAQEVAQSEVARTAGSIAELNTEADRLIPHFRFDLDLLTF
jgi:hypothetical protein